VRGSFAETSDSTGNRKNLVIDEKKLEYGITLCPWVAAWKGAGFSAQEIEIFCHVISHSHRAPPEGANPKTQLENDQGDV
jgi:hypothetical protein